MNLTKITNSTKLTKSESHRTMHQSQSHTFILCLVAAWELVEGKTPFFSLHTQVIANSTSINAERQDLSLALNAEIQLDSDPHKNCI